MTPILCIFKGGFDKAERGKVVAVRWRNGLRIVGVVAWLLLFSCFCFLDRSFAEHERNLMYYEAHDSRLDITGKSTYA